MISKNLFNECLKQISTYVKVCTHKRKMLVSETDYTETYYCPDCGIRKTVELPE